MERVLANLLEGYAHQKELVPNEQFGFRKRHSTIAQFTRLTDYITHGYNINKHTGLVKLDLEIAFDTVWMQGLLYKLIIFNYPFYLIKFLQSYLTDRSFSVNIAGTASSSKPLVTGLPQGAVLSPILFILYTADMPRLPMYNWPCLQMTLQYSLSHGDLISSVDSPMRRVDSSHTLPDGD
jgi:hypothetical protein